MSAVKDKIVKRLEDQAKREGTLPRILGFYLELCRIQTEAQKKFGAPAVDLSQERVKERLISGRPLLTFNQMVIDWPLFQQTLQEVANLFARYPDLFTAPQNPEMGTELDRAIINGWFEGLPVPAIPGGSMMETTVQAALNPCLANYAEVLFKKTDQENWRRGCCPVCSGNPDFAFLEKETGARWLVCSRCDTEWLFQRLECPYCGCQDQNALSFFTDDNGRYRLYTCDRCRHYLKAIDLRQTGDEVLLPLERLLTMAMDARAGERGYHPCGVAP